MKWKGLLFFIELYTLLLIVNATRPNILWYYQRIRKHCVKFVWNANSIMIGHSFMKKPWYHVSRITRMISREFGRLVLRFFSFLFIIAKSKWAAAHLDFARIHFGRCAQSFRETLQRKLRNSMKQTPMMDGPRQTTKNGERRREEYPGWQQYLKKHDAATNKWWTRHLGLYLWVVYCFYGLFIISWNQSFWWFFDSWCALESYSEWSSRRMLLHYRLIIKASACYRFQLFQ